MRPGIGELRVFPSIWGHWAGGESLFFISRVLLTHRSANMRARSLMGKKCKQAPVTARTTSSGSTTTSASSLRRIEGFCPILVALFSGLLEQFDRVFLSDDLGSEDVVTTTVGFARYTVRNDDCVCFVRVYPVPHNIGRQQKFSSAEQKWCRVVSIGSVS